MSGFENLGFRTIIARFCFKLKLKALFSALRHGQRFWVQGVGRQDLNHIVVS